MHVLEFPPIIKTLVLVSLLSAFELHRAERRSLVYSQLKIPLASVS